MPLVSKATNGEPLGKNPFVNTAMTKSIDQKQGTSKLPHQACSAIAIVDYPISKCGMGVIVRQQQQATAAMAVVQQR